MTWQEIPSRWPIEQSPSMVATMLAVSSPVDVVVMETFAVQLPATAAFTG